MFLNKNCIRTYQNLQNIEFQPDKLMEVDRRIMASGRSGCSILIAVPASAQVGDVNNVIQQRPLHNLVSYLQEKQVAAVIPLPPNCKDTAAAGIMHAIPPCRFASDFLRREIPELADDYPRNDQLLVLVVRE